MSCSSNFHIESMITVLPLATVTHRLQRVMNATARVVSDTGKSDHNITRWTALAGYSRENWIQALCDGVPVSAWTGTSVLADCLWCCSSPTLSAICQPELSQCASPSTQHVWRSTTLARQSRTRCQMNLETRTSWDSLKRFLKTIFLTHY